MRQGAASRLIGYASRGAERSPGSIGEGVFFDVETDLGQGWFRRRGGRIEEFHNMLENIDNSGFVHIEADFEFLFKQGQFLGEFPGVSKSRPHFDESADNEDAHLNGAWAVEHVGGHDRAVLSKRVGEVTAPASCGL